jgi:hypothetical protein
MKFLTCGMPGERRWLRAYRALGFAGLTSEGAHQQKDHLAVAK